MSFTTAVLLITWAVLLVLALAVAGTIRQLRMLAATGSPSPRLAVGPAVGAPPPPIVELDPLPRPAALLFADHGCAGCAEVVPAFANGFADGATKVVLYADEAADGIPLATLAHQRKAFDDWRIPVTPYCVVIDEAGRVAAAGPVGSRLMLDQFGSIIERRILAT